MKIARTLLGLLIVLGIGCSKKAQTTPSEGGEQVVTAAAVTTPQRNNKPAAEWAANEILQQLLNRYRQAKTYRDNAFVRLTFRRGGQPFSEEVPTAVALERPSKLSLVAYQATVKCDGKELKARIDDPPSNNLDGQLVVRPAPNPLKLADLAEDRLLYDILGSRLGRQPIQLELLLENTGLVTAFGSDVACQRLDDATHAGRNCFRVEVPSATGPLRFWVDQADFVLRRLDFPAAALVPDAAQDPSVTDLELFADLRDAKIDDAIAASQFTLDIPAGAKRMKRFARPLQPLATNLLGQRPQAYYFTRLDGSRLSDADLQGKLAVLTWYHDNPACEATLQQVSQAAERLSADGVLFLAVATDPTAVKNDAIQKRLAEWNVALPIARDLEAFGDKSFHIEGHPCVVILDQRGAVQHFQVGGNPDLADQLVTQIERLKRGDDLAAEALAQRAAVQRRYEELVARGGPEKDELLDIPEAVIRRRSEPNKLQIKPLWTNGELKSAGNIVLTESAGRTRVFVFDGPRAVTEIDAEGKIAARHALEIPEQGALTFARTATDKEGRRFFVASAPLAPQVFVFDENWKLLLSYPPLNHAPLAVMDVTLVDLDEPADAPESLIATASGAGVVALTLTGEVRWRSQVVPNAISAAALPPNDVGSLSVFVAGEESGTVVRLNRFGHEEPPTKVANWPIGRIFAAGVSSHDQASLLGLSSNAKGEPIAVGLNDKLQERWNYPLPKGVHQRPIDPIHWSRTLGGPTGEWWIAGPDGSIHVITADGQLFDSFYYGAPLMGLAAAKIGDRCVLWVATAEGVAAWEIQPPASSKRKREY